MCCLVFSTNSNYVLFCELSYLPSCSPCLSSCLLTRVSSSLALSYLSSCCVLLYFVLFVLSPFLLIPVSSCVATFLVPLLVSVVFALSCSTCLVCHLSLWCIVSLLLVLYCTLSLSCVVSLHLVLYCFLSLCCIVSLLLVLYCTLSLSCVVSLLFSRCAGAFSIVCSRESDLSCPLSPYDIPVHFSCLILPG